MTLTAQEAISMFEAELGIPYRAENPVCHRLLLKAVVLPEKTKGGVYLTEGTKQSSKRHYNIGKVLKMGPDAYVDPQRFPQGPLCKLGDWVRYSLFEKQDADINDFKCYYIDDERILGVIEEEDLGFVIPELRSREV